MADPNETLKTTASFWQTISPWLGPAVIASGINVLYDFIKISTNKKENINREHDDKLSDLVSPILDSAEEVIGRFSDVIKNNRKYNLSDMDLLTKQIMEFDVNSKNDEITIIYRIMKLFASVVYFEQNRDLLMASQKIKNCEFYLLAKLKMALKSNLSDSSIKLQSESVEYIGQKMLQLAETKSPRWINFYAFINKAKEDSEFLKLINSVRSWFNIDWNIDPTPQTIAASMFFVYLIDFYHDMGIKRRWDSLRLHFINIIYWYFHSGSKRIPYLYNFDDLDSKYYFATLNTIYSDRLGKISKYFRIRKNTKKTKRISYSVDGNILSSKTKNEKTTMKYQLNPTESLDKFRKMK
jgi:hypothetical protein